MAFSFYYTDKIASLVRNRNPLMQEILEESENYKIKSVNAQIKDDYIIPGLNGIQVNAQKSFYKMQESDVFNKYFLVLEQVKPKVSVDDNRDKIIKYGNNKQKRVSFIVSRGEISDYFREKNIKASELVTMKDYKSGSFLEPINDEDENFRALQNSLNLNKENKHICVIKESNKDVCRKQRNFLVEPSLVLTKTNLLDVKKEISNGSIVKIENGVSLDDVSVILREVKFKDLEIVYLSELISEKR